MISRCSYLDSILESMPNEILDKIFSHFSFPQQIQTMACVNKNLNCFAITWAVDKIQKEMEFSLDCICTHIPSLKTLLPKADLKEAASVHEIATWIVCKKKEAIRTLEEESETETLGKVQKEVQEIQNPLPFLQDIVLHAWSSLEMQNGVIRSESQEKKLLKKLTRMPPGTECYKKVFSLASGNSYFSKLVLSCFASQENLSEALFLYKSCTVIDKIPALANLAGCAALQGNFAKAFEFANNLSERIVSKELKEAFYGNEEDVFERWDVKIGALLIAPLSESCYVRLYKMKAYYKILSATIKKNNFGKCFELLADFVNNPEIEDTVLRAIASHIVGKTRDKGFKKESCDLLRAFEGRLPFLFHHFFLCSMASDAVLEGNEDLLECVIAHTTRILVNNKQAFLLDFPRLSGSLNILNEKVEQLNSTETKKLFDKLLLFFISYKEKFESS
jgi:hypothetical protein